MHQTNKYKAIQEQVKKTKHTLNQNQRLMKLVLGKVNKLVDIVTPTFDKLKSFKQQ